MHHTLSEDDLLLKVRFELVLVGAMTLFTLMTGLIQGLVIGGLFGQDAALIPLCGWIQGAVGGLICCGAYSLISLLQAIAWVGLLLKKPWGWGMGLLLASLYTCSFFFPIGIGLFVLLLSQSKRDLYRAATS